MAIIEQCVIALRQIVLYNFIRQLHGPARLKPKRRTHIVHDIFSRYGGGGGFITLWYRYRRNLKRIHFATSVWMNRKQIPDNPGKTRARARRRRPVDNFPITKTHLCAFMSVTYVCIRLYVVFHRVCRERIFFFTLIRIMRITLRYCCTAFVPSVRTKRPETSTRAKFQRENPHKP